MIDLMAASVRLRSLLGISLIHSLRFLPLTLDSALSRSPGGSGSFLESPSFLLSPPVWAALRGEPKAPRPRCHAPRGNALPRRSASLTAPDPDDAPGSGEGRDAERRSSAFPRGAWERGGGDDPRGDGCHEKWISRLTP